MSTVTSEFRVQVTSYRSTAQQRVSQAMTVSAGNTFEVVVGTPRRLLREENLSREAFLVEGKLVTLQSSHVAVLSDFFVERGRSA